MCSKSPVFTRSNRNKIGSICPFSLSTRVIHNQRIRTGYIVQPYAQRVRKPFLSLLSVLSVPSTSHLARLSRPPDNSTFGLYSTPLLYACRYRQARSSLYQSALSCALFPELLTSIIDDNPILQITVDCPND